MKGGGKEILDRRVRGTERREASHGKSAKTDPSREGNYIRTGL